MSTTPRSVAGAGAPTRSQESLGGNTACDSGPLFERTPLLRSVDSTVARDAESLAAIADAAMQDAVDAGWTKRSDFADDLGEQTSQVSLELNRAKDKRLKTQTWNSNYVVQLMQRPAALFRFIQRLGEPFGIQSVMIDPRDEGAIRRELARELPERRRRAFEREHGLPEGWLDR